MAYIYDDSQTYTGEIVNFTSTDKANITSVSVPLTPTQDLHGYDHPWPAGGGKNKLNSGFCLNRTQKGLKTVVNADGSITLTGTSDGTARYWNSSDTLGLVLSAGTYTLSPSNLRLEKSGGGIATGTFTLSEETEFVNVYWTGFTNGEVVNTVVYPQLESGSTATEYSRYSNICPISGRTGANAYVSPAPNIADATTYAADWTTPAGTVYAGSADIVTGDIKAAPYYASYNGETLVGPWVSSMDVYDPEGTPTTGAQVVDLGGTMTEYHITGQDIITLVGDNYIWSDSGDVTITE